MARLEVIAGNFGTGHAEWINFEFQLPKKQRLPIESIASVEENGEYLERSVLGFFKGGASGALGLGATAMVVGVFAAPLAAVGAIGLTAAAIGGGIGALGGRAERKVLMQVMMEDGRGFVAVCEADLPGEIRKAVSVAHAMRMRHREAAIAAAQPQRRGIAAVWERRPTTPVAAAPLALPGPTDPPVVDMQPNDEGIFTTAGNAIAATAESAGNLASDAYAALRSRLPWPASGT